MCFSYSWSCRIITYNFDYKKSKKLLIANKESIICGWNIIKNEFIKYNTNLIPVTQNISLFSN